MYLKSDSIILVYLKKNWTMYFDNTSIRLFLVKQEAKKNKSESRSKSQPAEYTVLRIFFVPFPFFLCVIFHNRQRSNVCLVEWLVSMQFVSFLFFSFSFFELLCFNFFLFIIFHYCCVCFKCCLIKRMYECKSKHISIINVKWKRNGNEKAKEKERERQRETKIAVNWTKW